MSHGLLSEPYISFTAVYPNPPRNLTIQKVANNKVTLSWLPPQDSLYTGYVIRWEFSLNITYVQIFAGVSCFMKLNVTRTHGVFLN